MLLASPFLPLNGAKPADVLSWNASEQEYSVATNASRPGEGFYSLDTGTVVFLTGEVVLEQSNTTLLQPALNAVGYPYSSPMRLDETELGRLASNGFQGAESTWGKGFWYRPAAEACVVWTEVRPYADVFPTNDASPEITEVEVLGGTSVVLHIRCAGEPAESLDILCQDAGPTQRFDTTAGWKLAAESLPVHGQLTTEWADSGSTDRLPVNRVAGRYYLVGRADIDLNENGLPDARERFVSGLEPDNLASSVGFASAGERGGVQEVELSQPDSRSAMAAGLGRSTNEVAGTSSVMTGRVIYVDERIGNDAYTGSKAEVVSQDGPKATIRAGLGAAGTGGRVVIRSGNYGEDLNIVGKKVRVRLDGDVNLCGRKQALETRPVVPLTGLETNR